MKTLGKGLVIVALFFGVWMLLSQIDFMASFSKMLKIKPVKSEATDSEDMLNVLLGKTNKGRTIFIRLLTATLFCVVCMPRTGTSSFCSGVMVM